MQSGQKAKMRDSTPLSYSISPRFSKSTMQRTIAVFVSLTTGERLSQQILCFSHTLSFSHIFQFSNPFLPIASKGKGGSFQTLTVTLHKRISIGACTPVRISLNISISLTKHKRNLIPKNKFTPRA